MSVVRVQVPPGSALGTVMSRIRVWLDANKIQLRSYQPVDGHELEFELNFNHESEAHLFQAAFNDLESVHTDK